MRAVPTRRNQPPDSQYQDYLVTSGRLKIPTLKPVKLFTLLVVFVLLSNTAQASLLPPQALVEATGSPDSFMQAQVVARAELPKQALISWGGRYKAGNWYPQGWCTFEVSRLRGGVSWTGNANQWIANAKAAGIATGSTPKVGAIMSENLSYYGHVSYVTEVHNDGSWTVREMNYEGFGVVSYRTLPADYQPVGFIY